MKILDLLEKTIDNRGRTPPVTDDGYCLLEINCIAGKDKYPDYSLVKKHVTAETYNSWFRSGHPQKGDILIPTVGTLDAVSMMDRDDCCIAQNLVAFRSNPKICDCDFLYYLLCDPTVRTRVLQLDIGAVQPSIKVPHLKNLEVEIPDLDKQKKIARILNILDKKIAINKKVNENLEQQIEAFLLDFLDNKETKPAKLGDYLYIKGRIGWKGLKKSEYLSQSNYRIINGETLTKSGIDWNKAGYISEERYVESPEIMLQVGDILLSKDGTIGKIGYVDSLELPTSVASGIFVIRNNKPNIISTTFIYYLLKSRLFESFIAARTEGSVIPHLYQKDFMEFEFPLPTSVKMAEFEKLTEPMFSQIINNLNENKKLVVLRDALLPKLMSGELDVSDLDI